MTSSFFAYIIQRKAKIALYFRENAEKRLKADSLRIANGPSWIYIYRHGVYAFFVRVKI